MKTKYKSRDMDRPAPIDTTQFHGPGAVFALLLAHVRYDAWHAPKDSMAYKTAMAFLEGHVGVCPVDGEIDDWGEHRDLIVGSLGIDIETFIKAVKAGRVEA